MDAETSLTALIEADMKGRGLGQRAYADAIGVDHAVLSRFLNGRQAGVSRENARKIATALELDASLVDDLLAEREAQRRGRHKPGLGPTGHGDDLTADLMSQMREVLEEIRQIKTGGLPPRVAWAREDASYEQPMVPGVRGKLTPVRVPDDALIAEGIRAESVAWIDPTAAPHAGDVVAVAADDDTRLKVYEPGDEALGVVRLVQTTF